MGINNAYQKTKTKNIRIEDTDVTYKKRAIVGGTEVAIYLLKYMPGIKVLNKEKLEETGLI